MKLKEYFKSSKFKNFIIGMGSIFDITGSYFSYKPSWMREDLTPQEQDALAIRGDWEAIGNDLRKAIEKTKKSLANKLG